MCVYLAMLLFVLVVFINWGSWLLEFCDWHIGIISSFRVPEIQMALWTELKLKLMPRYYLTLHAWDVALKKWLCVNISMIVTDIVWCWRRKVGHRRIQVSETLFNTFSTLWNSFWYNKIKEKGESSNFCGGFTNRLLFAHFVALPVPFMSPQ